jgi:hypothetical protein
VTRTWWIRTVVGIVGIIVAVVGVGGMQSALDAAFDRGMRAGVEYQQYFCPDPPAEDLGSILFHRVQSDTSALRTTFQP